MAPLRLRAAAFAALALALLPLLLAGPARAAEPIHITIAVEDSEIITADLKRIRLAEPAELRLPSPPPISNRCSVPTSRRRARACGSSCWARRAARSAP